MGRRRGKKNKGDSPFGLSSLQKEDREALYPYSLSQKAERVFLKELEGVLDVALWRADEIESYMEQQREKGSVVDQSPPMGRWVKSVSGETRLFGSIEAFFAAWARASLILYPTKGNRLRGRHLRAVLGLTYQLGPEEYLDRDLRDGWMHLDEDIDRIVEKGDVAPSSVADENVQWYDLAMRGSVRIIDPVQVAVALPLRSVALLRPYFHRADALRQRVVFQLTNEYAWTTFDGISGIAVLRTGKRGQPDAFFIKALGTRADITAEAQTYPELVEAFETRVKQWRAELSLDNSLETDKKKPPKGR
jgi:hypothetical protein